jgi:hypothetical protein
VGRKNRTGDVTLTSGKNAAFSSSFDRWAGNRAKKDWKSFTDGLLWYCDNATINYMVYFELNNIEKTFAS